MELTEFLSKLDAVEPYGDGQYMARCPAHQDAKPSLSVHAGRNGGVLVKCQRGCETKDVVAGLGLTLADLMGEPYVEAEYAYTDEAGRVRYVVQRWANPKTFRVHPGLPIPAWRVLYQAEAIAWCRANDKPVYVVEGERDVETLKARGIAATCNVGGANKWLPHYNELFYDLDVVVIADNDDPGVQSARTIVAELRRFARSVSLKYSPIGSDVTDLLEAGYSIDALQDLPVEGAAYYVASQIQPRKVDWLWKGYIPFGKVTFIEGDPGDGKSLLTLDLIARLTTGAAMPDGWAGVDPIMTAVVSAEDEPADTITPRLLAAGANLDRVVIIPHGITPDHPFELARDIPPLRDFCVSKGIRVVIFDPVNAFLGERVDSHNDSSTRRGLMPLKTLASVTGAAVIGIRHLNKGGVGVKAIYRSGGSIAFVGMARAAFLVAPKPTDPTVKVVACVKMSLARKPPSLTYTIEANGDGEPYLLWGPTIDATAQEILDGPEPGLDEDKADELVGKRNARDRARQFLFDVLDTGPMAWNDIVESAAGDHEARTLRRARDELVTVESFREMVDGKSRTMWRRKADANTDSNGDKSTWPLVHSEEWRAATPPSGQVAKSPDPPHATCSLCEETEGLELHDRIGLRCAEHHPVNRGEDL